MAEPVILPIQPTFDPTQIDRAIQKLTELQGKGFSIPINFVSNLEALKADAERVITNLRAQWQGFSSDISGANSKLISELNRIGESTAAARLKNGFASVREEVLVLDNLISQLNLKQIPGSELSKALAAGRLQDLAASQRTATDKFSFAGYGEDVSRATAAQEKFTTAEIKGAQTAAQNETAIASQQAALKAKALAFEEGRNAAQRFQRAEEEQAATTQRTITATKQSADQQNALIRTRFENQKLIEKTFAPAPGTTERVAAGGDTFKTVDRLKEAKMAQAELNAEMRLAVATQKAQGASAAALNATYAGFAKKLDDVAKKYSDLERAGVTSIARQAAAMRGAGANAIAAEEQKLMTQQQAAIESLQRQRSAALIRQAREQERDALRSGLGGVIGTVGTAAKFIATYQAIDVAIRAMRAGAEASIEFERKLATLSVVFRGTRDEAKELARDVLTVAAAFGQDGIAALDVATDFARFGGSTSEVLEAVRVVAQAANVAQIDLAESSKHFQAIMAGYQLTAGQLASVLGSLNTISNTYNVTVKQLLDGLARVAPLAKQAGIGLNELAGFEAVITGRTARPGAEAGQAIKSLISRLSKPQVESALSDVGIRTKDQSGELKTASQLVNELFLQYQKLGSAEKEELLIKVAGTQQAARIAALLDGYITSQQLAIRASRDLTSSDRENLAVRESLKSQLGTLRTEWEKFWVASAGSGNAAGFQGNLTEIVKGLSTMLSILTLLQNLSTQGPKGGATGEFISQIQKGLSATSVLDIGGKFRNFNLDIENARKTAERFGIDFKSDTEKAAEALIGFNKEVETLKNLGEADEAASRLFKTIASLVNAGAAPEKLEAAFRAAAEAASPGDLRGQEAIRTQLSALAQAGNYQAINVKLAELGKVAEADRTKQLQEASRLLNDQISKQTTLLTAKQKERDVAAGRGDKGEAERLDTEIQRKQDTIANLRVRLSGTFQQQFVEGEDPYKSAAINVEKLKTQVSELLRIQERGLKTTHLGDLDREAALIRVTAELQERKITAMVASGDATQAQAKDALATLSEERKELLASIDARRQYASAIDVQEKAERRIKDAVDAYNEVVRAIPTLSRTDELTNDRNLIELKDKLLQLEKGREEPILRKLGLQQSEIELVLKNIDAQRQALDLERERVNEQLKYAAAVDAAKRGVREAQAVTERFGGRDDTERNANLIAGLTRRRADRDSLTGLPLNVASARADFERARDPIEQARALARLKEFGITLQNTENDLVRRRFQLEAEITSERRKQSEEASKNLLMADRETQLRAALAAKFAQERGGRGFSASDFIFLDQRTKETIAKTNPDLLPPELKTRLRELQDESAALSKSFKPLTEAVDLAAKAIANLHLPQPALNPGNANSPAGIDVSAVSKSIDQSGHGVQTALDVLGTNIVRQFDAFQGLLTDISSQLQLRIARLETGSLTSRIGRAQGAASVLA